MLSHPHTEKVFPDIQTEPPVLPLVPIGSGPVTGQSLKRAWVHPLCIVSSDIYTH